MSYGPLTSPGTVIQDCDTLGDWTLSSGGTIEADPTHVKHGTNAIKLTTRNGATSYMRATINVNMSTWKNIRFWVLCHDPTANYSTLSIRFSSVSDWSKYLYWSPTGAQLATLTEGWNLISIATAEFVSSGGDSFADPMIRIGLHATPTAGVTCACTFDYVHGNVTGAASCVIAFDGPWAESCVNAAPILEAHDISGLWYTAPNMLNASVYATDAQVQALHAKGHCIGCYSEDDLTGKTQEQTRTWMLSLFAGIRALGIRDPRSAEKHVAYSLSAHNATTATALREAGALSARYTAGNFIGATPLDSPMVIWDYAVATPTSVATVETALDNAYDKAGSIMLLFHGITTGEVGANQFAVADFTTVIDYAVAKGFVFPDYRDWFDAAWRNLDWQTGSADAGWHSRSVTI